MSAVTSKDGTKIGYERAGSGPAVILVDGALCSRRFGPSRALAKLLAPRFSVFVYDRRGRGESGDGRPYDKAREVEDLAALVEAAGGSAALVGTSSGAALALEAAAAGLNVTRVAAYEPPYIGDRSAPPVDHETALRRMLAEGRRGDAVKYFMRDMVNVPAPVVVMMRLMFWLWPKLEAVAHTLPYDAAVMSGFVVPTERLGSVRRPVLVMHGGATDPRLARAATEVAAAIPGATHRVLDGQRHDVRPAVLAPVLADFLGGGR